MPSPGGTIRAPAVRSVGRQVRRPRPRLGEPVPAPRRSLRWRRRGLPGSGKPTRTHATRSDPGEVAASTASETRRDDLPSNARRRPSHSVHFGAQSRGLRAPCERFAPWVTPGPRITRFRLAADLGRMGLDTHRVSNKVSKITSRHLVPLDRAFPAHALLHESSRARTMPPDRILTGRCDTTLVGRGRSSDSRSHNRGRPHSLARLSSRRENHRR